MVDVSAFLTITKDGWAVDSAATVSMSGDELQFNHLEKDGSTVRVRTASGEMLVAAGTGSVTIPTTSEKGDSVTLIVPNVLYVPGLSFNLLSVRGLLDDAGTSALFTPSGGVLAHGEFGLIPLEQRDNLWWLLPRSVTAAATTSTSTKATWIAAHDRLGHPSDDVLRGLKYREPSGGAPFCVVCARTKATHASVSDGSGDKCACKPGELVHTDFAGPFSPSLHGATILQVYVDDATRYAHVYGLQHKSDAAAVLQTYAADLATGEGTGTSVVIGGGTTIRSDGEVTFRKGSFRDMAAKLGVVRVVSPPYTPQLNGVAERFMRTLNARTKALLLTAHLPSEFWLLAATHATFLYNRLPHSALGGKSPLEALTGQPPNLQQLRVFGSRAFVVDEARGKMDPTANEGIWVGLDESADGASTVWMTGTKRIIKSIHGVIDEGAGQRPEVVLEGLLAPEPYTGPVAAPDDILIDDAFVAEAHDEYYAFATSGDARTLRGKDAEAALRGAHGAAYKAAIAREMTALQTTGTWKIIQRADVPAGARVLRNEMILRFKPDSDTYKARLVVKGYAQEEGVDFTAAFAPVARLETVRLVLARAATNHAHVHQLDVQTAFLQGDLHEDVYMELPKDLEHGNRETQVCKLLRPLYGLRQAPRCWNEKLDEVLATLLLRRSDREPCLYKSENGDVEIVVWVDDMLVVAEQEARVKATKDSIKKLLPVTDGGPVTTFLGINVNYRREEGDMKLSQPRHVADILSKFGMTGANPVTTPMQASIQLVPHDPASTEPGNSLSPSPTSYRELVGGLMYLATTSRPDIAYATSALARFMASPTEAHQDAAKRVLRYLVGTPDLGLHYSASAPTSELYGHVDASWADDSTTRRSTSGYAFMLGGAAVAWKSHRQGLVTRSTTEAEYVALSEAAAEAIFLRALLEELGDDVTSAVTIYEDNAPAIFVAENTTVSGRTKHIDVHYHYIREQIIAGRLRVKHVSTTEQVADIFTKALPQPSFRKFRSVLHGM